MLVRILKLKNDRSILFITKSAVGCQIFRGGESYICICMYVHVFINIHTYTHTFGQTQKGKNGIFSQCFQVDSSLCFEFYIGNVSTPTGYDVSI